MNPLIFEYLTDSEKSEIIISRIKSHEYTIYNLEINKLEAELDSNFDQSSINAIDIRISDLQSKIAALKAEQSTLVLE